ncbi:MAG: hypothetical protein V2J55_10960 [Candidatus Competibacteraceae bacterium]|jgi:hypothetical protein|nr:hypothetical protein [Candidatus Competibacteraceae bacterium]
MKPADIDLDHIAQQLDALEKPKMQAKRQMIIALREPIKNALARGLSYKAIMACLAAEGISIHLNTLRSYVSNLKVGSNRESGNSRSKQSSPAPKALSSTPTNPAQSASQRATTCQISSPKKPVTLSGSGNFTKPEEIR